MTNVEASPGLASETRTTNAAKDGVDDMAARHRSRMKQAVHAYARDPTDENADAVEKSLRALRRHRDVAQVL